MNADNQAKQTQWQRARTDMLYPEYLTSLPTCPPLHCGGSELTAALMDTLHTRNGSSLDRYMRGNGEQWLDIQGSGIYAIAIMWRGERTFMNIKSSACSAMQSCSAVHFPIPPFAAKRVHLPSSLASMFGL